MDGPFMFGDESGAWLCPASRTLSELCNWAQAQPSIWRFVYTGQSSQWVQRKEVYISAIATNRI